MTKIVYFRPAKISKKQSKLGNFWHQKKFDSKKVFMQNYMIVIQPVVRAE